MAEQNWNPQGPLPRTQQEWQQELGRWGRDLEAFHGELVREEYLHDAGLKEELELAPIYRRWNHLFGPQAFQRARELVRSAPEQELRRRLKRLWEFVASGFLGQEVKEEVDRLGSEEARGSVQVLGEEIPYRALSVRMANEPVRQRRRQLQQARDAFTARLNPLREQIVERQGRLAREALGFSSYTDMYAELKGMDLDGLAATMTQVLESTRAFYEENFGQALRQACGVELGQAEKHDVAWLLRARQWDGWFDGSRLLWALQRTLQELGLDHLGGAGAGRVRMDTELRPRKSPRAFCAPVHVPGEVWLVILPQGGQDDFRALFHEAGHAYHFAGTDPDLPAEDRYLGDNTVTECYAFLLEHLVADPAWLVRRLGLSPLAAQQYADFARLDRLYFLRRYAGKLLYEVELHRSLPVGPMAARYREILSQATGVRYGEVDYLADVDDAFYVAEYLRAWALEVQLREYLRSRFGREWFARREAGEFLGELWWWGQRPDGDQLARHLGFDGVEFGPLVQELTVPDGVSGGAV